MIWFSLLQGFNGAATFPSRMLDRHQAADSELRGFNGAATFPSRMHMKLSGIDPYSYMLQWGRDVSVADAPRSSAASVTASTASMGPRRFRRGCYSLRVNRELRPMASM